MSDNEEIEGEGEAAVEEPIVEEEEEDERQFIDPQLIANNLSQIQKTAGKLLL